MIDYIACIVVRLLNKIFEFVPISVTLWVGRRLGSIAFFFNKKRRLVAYANLKSAFAGEKSPEELRAITKRVYQNMVQTFMEVLNLTKVKRKYVDKYIEIVKMERIRNASKSGRGTILLTAHFGDWELSSLTSSVVGFPITVLVREQKMKRLNELLNRMRESNGCKVIRKGMSTKNILRALYAKNIVGVLSDQDAGKKGMFVDFFGRPASCHSGPFEMAKHTDSLILPNFIVRTGGPYHKVYLEEYIDFRSSSSSFDSAQDSPERARASRGTSDDVKEKLQKFTSLLESYIRRYPDQWLWLHKRWKSTPVRTILVLNDGRAGHLNQSLAVARQFQKARVAQGYGPGDTRIVTVNVKFKSSFSKNILSLCAGFATWRCHGCMRCMKLCLDNGTYEMLMKTYADFVISCGSSLTAVNVFMSKENNAKNIGIMKPNIFTGLKKFSLAIIPRHDFPPRAKNVVETVTAPNLIDDEVLKNSRDALSRQISMGNESAIGLFAGGDTPEFSLTKDIINSVIDNMSKFARSHRMDILATTSRRTPKDAEGALKNRLGKDSLCKLLIIANEKNLDCAVPGILSLSSIVVVSGESISMISEAIASGKPVVVFTLDKKRDGLTKHEVALRNMEKEGYITIASPGSLASNLEKVWRGKASVRKTKDMDKILERVKALI